jgi:hypothetical protein
MDIELILGDFFNNFNKLESLSQQKHSELSKVDIELSEFYHEVEGEHLSHNVIGLGEGCLTDAQYSHKTFWQLLPNPCYALVAVF